MHICERGTCQSTERRRVSLRCPSRTSARHAASPANDFMGARVHLLLRPDVPCFPSVQCLRRVTSSVTFWAVFGETRIGRARRRDDDTAETPAAGHGDGPH